MFETEAILPIDLQHDARQNEAIDCSLPKLIRTIPQMCEIAKTKLITERLQIHIEQLFRYLQQYSTEEHIGELSSYYNSCKEPDFKEYLQFAFPDILKKLKIAAPITQLYGKTCAQASSISSSSSSNAVSEQTTQENIQQYTRGGSGHIRGRGRGRGF